MSRAVLISIRPEWCAKIAMGEKTIEVRKTRPKLDTPFKCYIYQTRKPVMVSFSGTGKHISEYDKTCWYTERSGKVIGDFVCTRIDRYVPYGCRQSIAYRLIDRNYYAHDIGYSAICLSEKELSDYGARKDIFGWHISDLKIYNEPKPLQGFTGLRKTKFGYAPYALTRPPQSWCYVKETEVTDDA